MVGLTLQLMQCLCAATSHPLCMTPIASLLQDAGAAEGTGKAPSVF